ncbi:MAG: acyl-CoA dehydrogenase domain protein [Frankiales bacterium]|nr:acyl-CoA dehydrogenase domain protein [Frankiales bacterium]
MTIGVSEDHEALAASVRGWAERAGLRASARAALEGPEVRPAWWQALAEQGLLGLHVAEENGGSGAGGVELAVAVEELARALAPGPALPTLCASLVLAQVGGTAAKELLPALVDGTTTAAVAVEDGLTAVASADGLVVSGTATRVLGGGLADVLLLGAGDTWFVVEAAQATVTPLAGLDATRRPASVTLHDVAVPASRVLPGLTLSQVRLFVGVVVAAEATGLAGWALDTAAAYATTREQFGRPIGAFQGIKHKCADMLVRLEQARATVWDAARALDEPPSTERDLSAAIAIAVAVDAAVLNAKDALQVLGGIGYTWEHDAHVVLKRALSLRALIGDPSEWRALTADLALAGARRRLELDLGSATDALRAEVRAVLANLPAAGKERDVAVADAGLLVPHWPAPWGRNASAVEQLVIDEEFAAAGVKRHDLIIGGWAAPTIVAHGTPGQQERFVRPTLHGDIVWCQMFSEPGAGSDLASLQTKAERVEGGWRITGQKVWTSMAQVADWAILLARTSGTGKGADRHRGITYFLLDMTAAGVDVRPLRELTGHAAFNEVFLDDVFVPDECVVGAVDGGWPLARTTLANERVAMSSGSPFGRGVEDVLADVNALGTPDPLLRDKVGHLVCEAHGQALLAFRTTLRQLSGAEPGSASSVRKLVGMRHQQDAAELRFELLGLSGLAREGAADKLAHTMLNTRCLTIAGGTSEVLKNVVAERILGLPRDV